MADQLIISEERLEGILSKFLPIKLSCLSPRTTSHLWVFWSQEEATSSVFAIQNKIKAVLGSIEGFAGANLLIQFWAPMVVGVGGRCLLTTSHQPFAITYRLETINENEIQYRNHCVGYTFEDGDGVIGRVFQNQLPELSKDVSDYYLKDHPLRDIAKSCGLTQFWAFPLFEQSQQSQSCVGVLEFLFSQYTFLDITYFDRFCSNLEHAGLVTLYPQVIQKQIWKGIINHVSEAYEIKEALRKVRNAHNLSLACAWVRCNHTTSWCRGSNPNSRCNDSNVSRRGDFLVYVRELSNDDNYYIAFCDYMVLDYLIMRVGEGLIGNAFLSDKPYLCTDVTQLSLSHYPMAHGARHLAFTGCITICLQSIATGNRDYVLQFYLSIDMVHSTDLHNLMSSMLATLKHHLKSFEAIVGDPGHELFTEIDIFSIDSVFELLKTPPTIISEIEPGATYNEGEVLQANFPGQYLAMEEFANTGGIVGDSLGLEQRGKAIPPENKCPEKNSPAHNQKESSCSYETLKQHFGKKLEYAAESLGVSRSTVKRWCRENNISRWPFPKRSKVTSLPPILNQINEPTLGNVAPTSDSSGKHPSSSNGPTETKMVKATHRNDIIKFQLPFSSRRIDLMENVTLRLKLSEGTFAIKYHDNEGDYILIACDVDLQDCINSFRTMDQTAIKMLIEPLQ